MKRAVRSRSRAYIKTHSSDKLTALNRVVTCGIIDSASQGATTCTTIRCCSRLKQKGNVFRLRAASVWHQHTCYQQALFNSALHIFDTARLAFHRYQSDGCRSRTGLTASSSDATCRMVDSACHAPTTCTLIGIPSLLVPNRIAKPGKPVTLSGTVAP